MNKLFDIYVPCVLSRNVIKEILLLDLRPTLDLQDNNVNLTMIKTDIFMTMFLRLIVNRNHRS